MDNGRFCLSMNKEPIMLNDLDKLGLKVFAGVFAVHGGLYITVGSDPVLNKLFYMAIAFFMGGILTRIWARMV